ncbi:MAG: hypothetical protein AABN33_02150 [Acidobacteriota bacterium]
MERLDSGPNKFVTANSLRFCQARMDEGCKKGDGRIEPERAKTARYCAACATLVRRDQSAKYKRDLRKKLGSRGYRAAYLSSSEEDERARHRIRVRRWRERMSGRKLLRRRRRTENSESANTALGRSTMND